MISIAGPSTSAFSMNFVQVFLSKWFDLPSTDVLSKGKQALLNGIDCSDNQENKIATVN